MLTERTQVLLEPSQRRRLEGLARRRGVSVGAVIREAIDAYVTPASHRTRRETVDALFSLELPAGDWDSMKAEIEQGALG